MNGDIEQPPFLGQMGDPTFGDMHSGGLIGHMDVTGDMETTVFGDTHTPPVIGDLETVPSRLFGNIPIIPVRRCGHMETPPHSRA